MRPLGPESLHSDCVLVVGISRPKLAAVLLSVMLFSLFLTFHVLYDSAVYSIQVTITPAKDFLRISKYAILFNQTVSTLPDHRTASVAHHFAVSRSAALPTAALKSKSHRIHFPKTSRRLPQVSNIKWPTSFSETFFFYSPPSL